MAFLGIPIKLEAGRLFTSLDIPGKKEGLSDLHVTILCFEDDWPISELSKALEVTYDVISDIKPFTIKIKEISCFPKRENKPCPIIAKVESDDLQDLCKKLRKAFDKKDIDYSKTFKEYKPHITLSYADKEIDSFKIDPIEISVHEITLLGGNKGENDIFITFPLKCAEKKKNASLLTKIDLFYKMAGSAEEARKKYFKSLMEAKETGPSHPKWEMYQNYLNNRRIQYELQQEFLDSNPEALAEHLRKEKERSTRFIANQLANNPEEFKKYKQKINQETWEKQKKERAVGSIEGILLLMSQRVAEKKKDVKNKANAAELLPIYEQDAQKLYNLRNEIRHYIDGLPNEPNRSGMLENLIQTTKELHSTLPSKWNWQTMGKILQAIHIKLTEMFDQIKLGGAL